MIMNQVMNVMEKLVNEIKDAPPEERDHFMKMTLSFIEMGTESFRKSPEFRRQLAEVLKREIEAYLQKG